MKIPVSIFVLIFSLAFASCNLQHSQKQILEITSNFSGSWWMNGQVLDFRLYDDGTVEYDEYSLQSLPNAKITAKTVITKKQIKINEAELKEILDILASDEFSNIEKDITPQKSCIDAFIDTKLNLNLNNAKKQIVIKNHCSTLANSQSTSFHFKDFPVKINDIFQKIKKIKDKESSGKFYN